MNKNWRRPKPLIPSCPGLYRDEDVQQWLEVVAPGIDEQQSKLLKHAITFVHRKGRDGNSPETYRGFRNELERFLLYCLAYDKEPATFRSPDITDYVRFCQAPPRNWIMVHHYHRFDPSGRPNEDWRPFYFPDIPKTSTGKKPAKGQKIPRATVSQSMIHRQYSFLNQWFKDLLDHEYVARNPVPVAKTESPFLINKTVTRAPKHFNKSDWLAIMNTLLALANADPKWERALFIILLMKTCYLRVGDLADKTHYSPTMGDFGYERGYLFLYVMSKRKKDRQVSVPEALIPYIIRYRETRGLSGMPEEGEDKPLIAKNRGMGNLKVRQITRIVAEGFGAVSEVLKSDNPELSDRLKKATAHWLRHTGASIDALWRPLPELAEEMGHEDPATTGRIYVNSSLEERGRSGSQRAIA